MSFERPTKGVLVFQCDACFDTYEFCKADGADVGDFRQCWRELHDEGWTLSNTRPSHTSASSTTEHLCSDCSQIARTDRDNPFRK